MAKHSFNKTVWQCLTLISQFGIMMLVPTGMMFCPRLLAGWQARDAVFCSCAVFCWRFGGIWEHLPAGAANLSEEGQKGQGMRNFFKKIDETVREMWLGTFLWGCLCELVSVWWVKDRLYSGLGILIGMPACHGRNLAHVEGAGYSAGARKRRTEICDVEESSPVCGGFSRVCSPDADTFCRPVSGCLQV